MAEFEYTGYNLCCSSTNGGYFALRLRDPSLAVSGERYLPADISKTKVCGNSAVYQIEYDANLLVDPSSLLTAEDFDLRCLDANSEAVFDANCDEIRDCIFVDGTSITGDGSSGNPFSATDANETITTLVDNENGTYTYTSEDATTTTFDSAPPHTNFQEMSNVLNVTGQALNVNFTSVESNVITFTAPAERSLNVWLVPEGSLAFSMSGASEYNVDVNIEVDDGSGYTSISAFPALNKTIIAGQAEKTYLTPSNVRLDTIAAGASKSYKIRISVTSNSASGAVIPTFDATIALAGRAQTV